MRIGIVVALAATLAAVVAVGGAFGEGNVGGGRLTLHNPEYGVYEGNLESEKAGCEKRRRVHVYHDQNKNGYDPSDYHIGSDKTNRKGDYEVNGNQAPAGDQIVARVGPRTLAGGTHCLGEEKKAVATAK
jgi:hypothetical protein